MALTPPLRGPPAALNPLRSSPLPLARSPMKALAKNSDSGANPSGIVLRGLRRDLVEMQNFIDAFYNRSVPSAQSRELEDALLCLQEHHSASDRQVFELLQLVKDRSVQICAMCGVPPSDAMYTPLRPVVGDFVAIAKALVALEEEIAAANLTAAALIAPSPCAAECGDSPPLVAVLPSDGAAALTPQQAAGKSRLVERLAAKHESRSTLRNAELTQPGSLASPSDQGLAASSTGLADHSMQASPMSAGQRTGRALPSGVLDDLRTAGVETAGVDIDTILKNVASVAAHLSSQGLQAKDSFSATRLHNATTTRLQTVLLQLTAAEEELRHKDETIRQLRLQLEETRFSPNRIKTITTVHDAPMSCQVEKEYLKEHRRAMMRIAELEQDYKQLYDSGDADRQKNASLTKEVAELRQTVKNLERQAEELRQSREEQEHLFVGVSKARQEEAAMCAAAVAQLEGRVTSLKAELESVKHQHDVLQTNFETLFDDWCIAQQRIEEAKVIREYLETDQQVYEQHYTLETLQQLEATQKQLLSVWAVADENEAQRTLLRQQNDDAQNAIRLLVDESKNLLERVRSSTEWKLLTVKAPDETKQLLSRWQAMQAEREKRETAALKAQADRNNVYRQRATMEVATRQAQHRAEVNLVNATEVSESCRRSRPRPPPLPGFQVVENFGTIADDNTVSDSLSRIPKDVRQGFVLECSKRLLTFEQFWQEIFPGEDL